MAVAVCKTAFVLDNGPDLLVGELVAETNHGGPGHPILDHPKHFAFAPVTPKPMMTKVSGVRIQRGGEGSIARPASSMTILARPLAFVEGLSFGLNISGRRKRTRQRSGFSELVGRDSRLHDVLLRRVGEEQSPSTENPAESR
jgi:hypothetical protein